MTEPTDTTPPTDELGHRRRVIQLSDDVADLICDISDRAKELHEIGVPSREWLDVVALRFGVKARTMFGWAIPYVAPALDILLSMDGKDSSSPGIAQGIAGAFASTQGPGPTQGPGSIDIDVDEIDMDEARNYAAILAETGDDAAFSHAINLARAFLAVDADLVRPEPASVKRMRRVIDRLFRDAPKMTGPDGAPDDGQAPAMEVHMVLRGVPVSLSGILSTTPEGGLRLMTHDEKRSAMMEQFFDYADVVTVVLVREIKVSGGSPLIRPS